jgi:RNA polymerase sigma factor (sigma-70 family)
MMSDDMTLVREFAANQSEPAFAALVERHIALVHSAALRQVGNAHLAEEITQAVFIILARKAASFGPKTILSAWLYRTTRYAAADALRARRRRQAREQLAYQLDAMNADDLSRRSETEADAWAQVAPRLDDALAELGETDRTALVLRFFERKTAREIAKTLRMEEATAQKRVARALEKLRAIFVKRGVTLTATAIAGAVAANSVQAAPAGLAAAVAVAKGTTISATITTLVKGTVKTMMWLKLKFAVGVSVAVLVTGGVATVAISQTGGGDKPTAQEIAGKSRDAYAALSSYSDSGTVVSEIAGQNVTTTFNIRLQRPNLYRIDWTQTAGPYTSKGVVWSDGSGDNLQITAPDFLVAAAGQKKNDKPQKMPNLKTALALATPLSGFAASTIPGTFFNQNLGDFVAPAASGRYPLKKEKDAKVGDVDCYVVSSEMIDLSKVPDIGKPGKASTMLWIGKRDFLIHQSRMRYVEKTDSSAPTDQAIDEAIKTSLKMQNKPATSEAVAAMRPQMKEIMKQVQTTLKSSFESGIVYTQTHENIVVNQKFSPADFAR